MSIPTETAPDTYAHGMKSELTVGSAALCVTKFEYELKYDKHDVTSTCNNGKKQYQLGLAGVDFSGEAKLDLTTTPFTTLGTGSVVSITWYGDSTGSSPVANFASTKCVIENVKITSAVNDIITYSFSGSAGPDFTVA